jgi:hypothetical protein
MSVAPERKPFVVPPSPSRPASSPSPSADASAFTRAATLVASDDREKLEPHWHPTIDAATD